MNPKLLELLTKIAPMVIRQYKLDHDGEKTDNGKEKNGVFGKQMFSACAAVLRSLGVETKGVDLVPYFNELVEKGVLATKGQKGDRKEKGWILYLLPEDYAKMPRRYVVDIAAITSQIEL